MRNGNIINYRAAKAAGGRAGELIAGIDVGTTKVSALIGRLEADGKISILGGGNRASRGVSAGAIIDMEETESAIRAAIDQAERVAGVTVDEVCVSLSTGAPRSEIVEHEIAIGGRVIEALDVDLLHDEVLKGLGSEDSLIVHAFPACYMVDDAVGVRDPVGMHGERLGVALHVVTATASPLRNLQNCVEGAQLAVRQIVSAAYAAGLACLVEDELELGAACIEIGGGTTSVSVFAKGVLVHADSFPLGGAEITEDLARILGTSLHHAERLKTLHSAAIESRHDHDEMLDTPQLGELDEDMAPRTQISRAELIALVQPKLKTIFDTARRSLEISGFNRVRGRRVIITGGCAQIPGLREYAQAILDRQVRIGRPQAVYGLADANSGPAFAVCAGLLVYAARAPIELNDQVKLTANQYRDGGRMARVGHWIRENF